MLRLLTLVLRHRWYRGVGHAPEEMDAAFGGAARRRPRTACEAGLLRTWKRMSTQRKEAVDYKPQSRDSLDNALAELPGDGRRVGLPRSAPRGMKSKSAPFKRRDMPFVTVSPSFRVTIPAKLRKGLAVREGDIMEATAVDDGILLRPKAVVERNAIADEVASILASVEPAPDDAGRSDDEITADAIAFVAATRRERNAREP